MIQLLNKKINKQNFDIPKILPNNLKRLKELFSLKNSVIAQNLGFHANFIGDVVNEKANFSGSSVIKFIKTFNIPFNLIYNVNSNVEYIENIQELYISILQLGPGEKSSNIDILKFCLKENIIKDSDEYSVRLLTEIKGNSISFTEDDLKSNYKYHLELIENEVKNYKYPDTNNKYFVLAYTITSEISVNKFINLQENLDENIIKYLDSIPFIYHKTVKRTISKNKVLNIQDKYKFADSYDFLINDKVINTDTIDKSMCEVNNNKLTIYPISSTKIKINKLKELREYKNYSLQDMADKLCISAATYLSIEKGHQKMSAQIMWKLEKEFGILLEHVLNIDAYYEKYC